MFSHFIYFIVALLVLSLYEAPATLPLHFLQALLLIVILGLCYAGYVRIVFKRLIKRSQWESQAKLDHAFTQCTTRCSVLALVILAADIWWLNLPAYLDRLAIFSLFPTLGSLLLLFLFIGYLTLMWIFSYRAHRVIYRTDIPFGNYIYSNLALSAPILIPWALLFGVSDLIQLLPYRFPQRILATPLGQTGYFLIFLFITAIFAPVLIQRFWRCQPLKAGEHRRRIEALCRKAGVRYADIVHWPIFGGRMITAGVMGLVARFRYILVTDALLSLLTPDEIDQVIAHEIGHVKHRHLLLYLLFFIGFILITYTVYPVSMWVVFSNVSVMKVLEAWQLNPNRISEIFLGISLILCIVVYFRFIFGYFIRNFERQADTYVFQLFHTARPLISTFDKIVASSGQPADKPNWHHFSIQQRVDYLWRCERSPQWISLHNKKVRRSIAVFVAGALVLGVAAYHLDKRVFEKRHNEFNIAVVESYLQQKKEKTREDAMLYFVVGNFYFDKNDLHRAAAAYEAALKLDADNPETLNNLAWLQATSDDRDLKDPVGALALARRALDLQKAPHIWDTLAECLFINGRIEEAIDAEQRALAMNPKDKKIYEDQLKKFKKALRRDS